MTAPHNNFSKLSHFLKSPRKDGLENILTGMGIQGRDSRLGARYRWTRLNYRYLEIFHDSSDIAKTVVNKIPDLATKKWITHIVDEDAYGSKIIDSLIEEDIRLSLKKKIKKAMAWARLYGGAAMFLVIDDGLPLEEPIDYSRINSIQNLVVFHRYEINHNEICYDITSKNFGLPDYYNISGRTNTTIQRIHHSRFIRFEGAPISEEGFRENDYWNDSHLTILHDVARDYQDAYNGIFRALKDFDVEILKLKDLANMVAAKEEDTLKARLALMQLSKSTISTIAIDSEGEDFSRLQRTFTGIGPMLDKIDKRLQGVTGIPHTVLFGEGSTGTLGAGGESEQSTLNDLVSIEQKNTMERELTLLFQLIQLQKKGPTGGKLIDGHTFVFNPLSEPTDRQQAEIRKIVAESDKIYSEIGALSADETSNSRFGPYGYSIETQIDSESRDLQKELDDNPTTESDIA